MIEEKSEKKIKIGLPKGSLQEHTFKIFRLAGFDIKILPRSYILNFDDSEIEGFLLRPQEIPKYVEEGKLDAGISGEDWITETKAKIIKVCDLKYAKKDIKKVKWVLAVPEKSEIKSIKDLEGKTISTEVVNIVKDYFKIKKIKVEIKFSFGATEVKPPRFADAIVDLTETGTSLKAHNLKVLDTVFESSSVLLANKNSWQDNWKKEKIRNLVILLKSAVESEDIIGLATHVPKEKLAKVLKILPPWENPTIVRISGTNLYDVRFTSHRIAARELLPKLKRMGCGGLVEFPLDKAIR
jgi:ATP phosphoribosyltransferase